MEYYNDLGWTVRNYKSTRWKDTARVGKSRVDLSSAYVNQYGAVHTRRASCRNSYSST